MNYYAFTRRYSFFNKANWNAGLSLGLRGAQFIVETDARANGFEYGASDRAVAPALLFGLHGSGYFTHRLLARYSLEYLGLKIQGLDINVIESRASLEYFIFENVGIGAAYSTAEYRVGEFPLNDNFEGRVLLNFSGGSIFLSARF